MLSLLLLSVFPAALLIAAANDLYEFKVPNWISIALFVAYLAAGPALGASASVMVGGLIAGAAALAAGFALFAFRIFGGGDAKLLAAIAPWIGVSGAAPALFNIAFAGGAVAIALMAFRKAPPLAAYADAPWVMRLYERKGDIPYAVAIAAGALMTFPHAPYFQLAFGG